MENELRFRPYLGKNVVLTKTNGDVLRGLFRRADVGNLELLYREGRGYEYEVHTEEDPDDPGAAYNHLRPDEIKEIRLAGLPRQEAQKRNLAFQIVGRREGLRVFGYMQGRPPLFMAFRAGLVMLEPNPYSTELPEDTEFRIWFTSHDGSVRRDVTDMSAEEFVAFMRSQPEQLREVNHDA